MNLPKRRFTLAKEKWRFIRGSVAGERWAADTAAITGLETMLPRRALDEFTGPLFQRLAAMRKRLLHILIIDPAVGVDVIAKVRRIGPFTQLSLDIGDIMFSNSPVTVYVANQETNGSLSRGQCVALIIMHIGEGNGNSLRVTGLTIEGH